MNYKILKPNKLNEIIPFNEEFSSSNIVIDLSELEISIKTILSFEEISTKKRENGTSFVIINSTIDIEKIPEEIYVVPSLQEAIDIIEMDEMMRDLE